MAGTLLVGLVLAACGKQEPPAPAATVPAPAASAPAPAAKVYVVGTDAAYAPFESQNEKGEIVGFDIEVVQAVAQKAGIEVRFLNTPWEGIFNTLSQGDRDLLVSAITITDERKQTMDFSAPYFDAQQLIAVKKDSKIAKFADLKKLKVGVQNGTTGDEVITKLQGKESVNIKRFESTPLALKELEGGGVDAVVADNGVVVHYVNNNANSQFKTISDASFASEQYGLAVKKATPNCWKNSTRVWLTSRQTAPTSRFTPNISALHRHPLPPHPNKPEDGAWTRPPLRGRIRLKV